MNPVNHSDGFKYFTINFNAFSVVISIRCHGALLALDRLPMQASP